VNKEICLQALNSQKTLNRLVCLCSALAGHIARRPHLCCRGSLTAILSSRLRDISTFILPRKFSSLLCSSKYVPAMLTLFFLLFRLLVVLQAQPLLLVNAPIPSVAFLGLVHRVRFLSLVMCSVWDWRGLKACWRSYCFAHRFLSLATLAKMCLGFGLRLGFTAQSVHFLLFPPFFGNRASDSEHISCVTDQWLLDAFVHLLHGIQPSPSQE
jgi:hypothetical protein